MATPELPSAKIQPLPMTLTPTPLLTNFYLPAFNRGTSIHVYALHFTPEVENDNRALRRELVDSVQTQLRCHLGGFVLSGLNIFGVKAVGEELNLPAAGRGREYTLSVQYTREVTLAGYQGQRDTSLVLNVIIKKMLRELGLLQVTKLPKYYDPKGTASLPQLGLEVWRGYATELNYYEGRPLVTIDFSSKIVHTRSLSDEMQEIREQAEGGDWVSQAKAELIDRVVMTKYGNRRCYRVDDICLDLNPESKFEKNGVEISYAEYFRRQYNISIKDSRQPLVRSHLKRRLEEHDVFLVPELLTLTGLDDNMRRNFQAMSDIAVYTRLQPEKRYAVSNRLSGLFNEDSKAKAVAQDFSFSISAEPVTVQSYNLAGESIYLSGSRTLPIGADGNFQVRENLLEPVQLGNWVVFASERDWRDAEGVAKALYEKLAGLKAVQSQPVMLPYDWRTFAQTLETQARKGPIQIAICLLSKRFHQRDYEKIKTLTTTSISIPTQVVMLPVNAKRMNAVLDKVALQIQAKAGAQLWAIRPSQVFGKFLMVVGIDVFHDTIQKKKSVLGFCATIHPNLSKYYSTTSLQQSGQEIATSIGNLFLEALHTFKARAKRYPETIIFFRDGVAESQIPAVKDFEVQSILRACEDLGEAYRPLVLYTVVVKKTAAKFFTPPCSKGGTQRGRMEVTNPPPGTVVINRVVPEQGDFYLISHSANQGMSSPTLYRTIFSSRKADFPLEELARLAYKLCHLYYNWTGAIKVPAPCMMAHKLAYLVGKFTHAPGATGMPTSPYYL
jgi:aubergine-like protein